MSGYFVALGYQLYVGLGTTASSLPTSSSGLTEVLSLSDASIDGSTDSTDAPLDYSSAYGWKNPLMTNIGWSVPAQMNLSLGDAGYKLLKRAWLEGASGTALQVFRVSPVKDGSGDNAELHSGIAFVEGFKESMKAGDVATISFTFKGTGQLLWYPQGNPIATLTITGAGTGVSAGTGLALTPVSPAPGVGSGLGATATIAVSGGAITTATIVSGGTNFKVGDTPKTPTGSGVTLTVATVS